MSERWQELFSFPDPVDEKAARVLAGVVAVTVLVILATSWYLLLIPLTYGFWARVLTGPTLSPLGRVAQRVIAPRLRAPKPGFAVCLGCKVYAQPGRSGLVPACEDCADLSTRLAARERRIA